MVQSAGESVLSKKRYDLVVSRDKLISQGGHGLHGTSLCYDLNLELTLEPMPANTTVLPLCPI